MKTALVLRGREGEDIAGWQEYLEIAAATGVTPAGLRADTSRHAAQSQAAADRFFAAWIDSLAGCRCKRPAAQQQIMQRCVRNF
jgi:hypothetical protein